MAAKMSLSETQPGDPRHFHSLWAFRPISGVRARTMDEIVIAAALRHRISVKELRGRSRVRHIAHVRQAVFLEAYSERRSNGCKAYSLPMIGRYFGRDHTTILHGIRAATARQDEPR